MSESDVEEVEESDREESEKEDVSDHETTAAKITFRTLLHKILQNQLPLSETHPGYLMGLLNLMESEQNLPAELENCLYGFHKIAKMWNSNTGKTQKKGVIEYLESCRSQTANLFEMCFESTTMESLKTLLNAYKETNITEEDCCRYVERTLTCTSSTTAHTATERAGATGGKRPRLMGPTVDEIDVVIDEIPVEVEPQPTWKNYSSIMARKEGSLFIRKSEEKWNQYTARVTIYRRSDLINCPKSSDKWKHKYQEMELNYDAGSQIWMMMNRLKGIQTQHLDQKNARWEPKREYNFAQ